MSGTTSANAQNLRSMLDNLNDIFARRGSVRSFDTSRHITDSDLDAMLEAAAHAPTTGNMQLYSVVVTRGAEEKATLHRLHLGQPAAAGADALLTFCADIRRFSRWCEARGADKPMDNFGGWLMAITDATIFAQQFNTLAELNGLGCVYLGTVTYNVEGFADALGLPEGVLPLFTIAVGYPAPGCEGKPCDRLPLSAIVHREKYADADIDLTYAQKEALPESAGFIKENGKTTLAQVFAEVRYPRALNERVGHEVLAHIKV